jgi:hypothetical protein
MCIYLKYNTVLIDLMVGRDVVSCLVASWPDAAMAYLKSPRSTEGSHQYRTGWSSWPIICSNLQSPTVMFSTETDRNPKMVARQVQRQQLDAGAVAVAGTGDAAPMRAYNMRAAGYESHV